MYTGDESQTGAGSMRLEYHCLQSSSGAYDDYDYVSGSFGFHGISADTFVLSASRMPKPSVLYCQLLLSLFAYVCMHTDMRACVCI